MHSIDIGNLRRIMERADLLLQKEYSALHSHWNKKRQCFHVNAAARKKRTVNLTTTCFGLFAILRNPQLLNRFFANSEESEEKAAVTALNSVVETIIGQTWKSENLREFNIYTTPIVVQTLYLVANDLAHGDAVKVVLKEPARLEMLKRGLERIITATEQSNAASFPPYEPSAYLTFWCFQALRGEVDLELVGGPVTDECRKRAIALAEWGEAELYRQLAFHAAGDMAHLDPIQLAYALRIYTEHKKSTSDPVNRKLIERALGVVFEFQNKDGLWPKYRPIFHLHERGSVYPFTYEMLDVLIPDQPKAELFEPHIPKLEASLRWAEDNYIDGAREKGWRTSHLPYGTDPEGWSTAAVLFAVRKIRAVVSAQINEDLLDDFRAQRNDTPDDSSLHEANFYDADVPVEPALTLKRVLTKYLINPHKPGGSDSDRRYSAVFYGPPGTAKTTLAKAIAKALGWPYVYLQTSDFAGEGVNQVIGKARHIFDRLSLLEKAVVLFDEVEEFVRDRKNEEDPSSRMLTTSMLSLIQELRSREGVIFIVATNFLDKFDAAITRTGGRFDMMVLISPPSKAEKIRMFKDRLAKEAKKNQQLDQEKVACLLKSFEAYVDQRFHESLYQFAFTEWRLLLDDFIADMVARDGTVDESALNALLRTHAEGIALSDNGLLIAFNQSKKFVRL